MTQADPAAVLEAILLAENEALLRHDAEAAVALLKQKLLAADALAPEAMTAEQGSRLRALAAENRVLLERAIDVQQRIVVMVAQAAQATAALPRYGADRRAIRSEGALALARDA